MISQWFLFHHGRPSLSLSLFFPHSPLTAVRDPEDPGLVSIHKALLIYSDPPSLSPLSLQLAGCLLTAGGEKGLEGTSTGVEGWWWLGGGGQRNGSRKCFIYCQAEGANEGAREGESRGMERGRHPAPSNAPNKASR